MIKRVLLPTDFSENSKVAIRYAIELYSQVDTTFYILNTYSIPHAGASMLVSIEDILQEESEKGLHDLKMDLSGVLNKGDLVHTLVEKGELADVVNRLVDDLQIDAVVLGTKGANGIREKLIGSNTYQVIQQSKIPVWVVPEDAPFGIPKIVALASDFSDPGEEVLNPLTDLKARHDCDIHLVNVQPAGGPEFNGKPNNLVEGLISESHMVKGDDLVETLNKWCADNKIDLLAMVRHKKSFFERLFGKSNTRRMSMHAHIPLLIMKD